MTGPPDTQDFHTLYIVTQLFECDLERSEWHLPHLPPPTHSVADPPPCLLPSHCSCVVDTGGLWLGRKLRLDWHHGACDGGAACVMGRASRLDYEP